MPLLNTADKLYFRSAAPSSAYFGTTKVWPSFDPTRLTGLMAWLDATQITGGAITTAWPDLSGLGHHGTIVGTPVPSVRTNALNGLPVVRFKPNEGRVRGNSALVAPLGPYNYTIVCVSRMVGPTVGRAYAGLYPESNFLIGFHSSGQDCMYAGGWIRNADGYIALPGPWKMYAGAGSHDGTTYVVEFYIDGVLGGSGGSSTGATGSASSGYNISGYSATGIEETCDCEVAEMVIYDHKLTTTERQQIESYLRAKWGLA